MTREQAMELLNKNMQNTNLRRHCYAVEAVMKSLAERLGHKDQSEKWGISGLLHDADWEQTQSDPNKHTHVVTEWIREIEHDEELQGAILSHGWKYIEGNPKPKSEMEWSLYCCDELTGLIVACALVKPDRKLSSVTVDTVLNKWKEKSFAKGVDRENIELCESTINIPLREFIEIALQAMQNISGELGL